MTNMVEIGPSNFDRDLSESKNISRRPVDRVRRWLTAAVAGAVLTTGAGIARDVRAEAPDLVVDGSTKIESSSEGIETPESVLESQGISNPDSPATEEGQITAKGVGDLLANADEGVVTNFKAGVEVPDSDGGEVQYGSDATNESGEMVIETLGVKETEKTPEQLIAEKSVNYLRGIKGYTDKEIHDGLMNYTTNEEKLAGVSVGEEVVDLGRIYTRNVQGVLLGHLKTNDGKNLLIFLGTKDRSLQRFITTVRVPLYVMEDKSTTFRFTINSIPDLLYTRSKGSSAQIKDSNSLIGILDSELNDNIIVNLYTDEITKNDLKDAKKVGTVMLEYANDMKKSVYCARSLDADVFDNGIKLEYPDPAVGLWSVSNAESVDSRVFKRLTSDSVENVPIILGLTYSSGD